MTNLLGLEQAVDGVIKILRWIHSFVNLCPVDFVVATEIDNWALAVNEILKDLHLLFSKFLARLLENGLECLIGGLSSEFFRPIPGDP